MPPTTRPVLDVRTLGASPQPVLDVPSVAARLRPWTTADAPAVRAVYADPAVVRWHARTLGSDLEAKALVAGWVDGWTWGYAEWAVVAAADDALLARVAVKATDPDGVGDVAYWAAPAARGRGVVPAAVGVASAWAFDVGYHRLQLSHSVGNAPSCRAAEKSGFVLEGTRRESELHADGWHDMHQHVRFA
ncbi:GNAT family N-acetyltransferase [Isoptericola jiangsuensis]|uniref:GNAT family N-acetyltransferase n=1 Tax=Isoptericola jiangsuensis TaxID=548579 RepID=UPI003AABF2EC